MASSGDGKQALMTVKELADYLRVSPETIYRLAKRNGVPFFKVGGDFRFRRDLIDEWSKPKGENERG